MDPLNDCPRCGHDLDDHKPHCETTVSASGNPWTDWRYCDCDPRGPVPKRTIYPVSGTVRDRLVDGRTVGMIVDAQGYEIGDRVRLVTAPEGETVDAVVWEAVVARSLCDYPDVTLQRITLRL